MIKHIGILGGTFDPVHNGHITCANYVQQQCALDEVRLMPCHLPAHRATPGVSSKQRAAMVQLAISQYPQLKLEPLELNKPSASYTAESLQLLHELEPDNRFYFIIGMDSLCYFRSWKNWPSILERAHLLVCQRPGYSQYDGDAPALLQQFGVTSHSVLRQRQSGGIMLLTNPLTDISASEIRRQLQQQHSPVTTLDPAVLNYIQTQQLYQA